MPTKRFDNLPEERKMTILDAARREFADNGFQNASLNGIIKNAGVSKGSLYYYFEDKTDLYLTVLDVVITDLFGSGVESMPEVTEENFWDLFNEQTLGYLRKVKANPDIALLTRDLYRMNDMPHASEAIAEFYVKIQAVYSSFFALGQELGVVRTDLPLDLLLSIMTHMGAALDLWVFERWEEISHGDLDSYAVLYADMIKKITSPKGGKGGDAL